jgi:hypothetical protein
MLQEKLFSFSFPSPCDVLDEIIIGGSFWLFNPDTWASREPNVYFTARFASLFFLCNWPFPLSLGFLLTSRPGAGNIVSELRQKGEW